MTPDRSEITHSGKRSKTIEPAFNGAIGEIATFAELNVTREIRRKILGRPPCKSP